LKYRANEKKSQESEASVMAVTSDFDRLRLFSILQTDFCGNTRKKGSGEMTRDFALRLMVDTLVLAVGFALATPFLTILLAPFIGFALM
jgi:hypothetical protein